MEATSALPILLPGSGVQAFVGFRLVLVENRVLPQYFRLVPVDFRLVLLDLHVHSPWLWEHGIC